MTCASFSVDFQHRRSYVVVQPRGELDCATAPVLAAALREAGRRGERIVVDLGGLDFMDTTGLRTLAHADHALADHGALLHLIAGERVDLVVRLTGMAARFRWIAREQLR